MSIRYVDLAVHHPVYSCSQFAIAQEHPARNIAAKLRTRDTDVPPCPLTGQLPAVPATEAAVRLTAPAGPDEGSHSVRPAPLRSVYASLRQQGRQVTSSYRVMSESFGETACLLIVWYCTT